MIKRHSQQVVNRQVPANRQNQQLGKMLGRGDCHLGTKEAAALFRRIQPQQPVVPLHDPRPALRAEVNFADQTAVRVKLTGPLYHYTGRNRMTGLKQGAVRLCFFQYLHGS